MNLRTAERDVAAHDAPPEEISAHQAPTRDERTAAPRYRGGSRRRPLPELGPDLDARARSARARIASLSRRNCGRRDDVLELRRAFRADRLEELLRALAGQLTEVERARLLGVLLPDADEPR